MATGGDFPLTNRQIQRLAASISRHDMESIAMGYLNISHEKIKSCRGEETEAFNQEMIILWANRNPENQVTVLFTSFIVHYIQLHSFSRRLLPAATKLGQGNVFTGVCHSVHMGGVCLSACWDTTPPPPRPDTPPTPQSRHLPRADTPQSRHPWDHTPPSPEQADTPLGPDNPSQT